MKKLIKYFYAQAGLTLIEIFVVILIVGIIAAIAIPNYNTIVEKSRMIEGVKALQTVRNAQLRYKFEHGAYATSLSQLDVELPPLKYFSMPDLNDAVINIVRLGDIDYTLNMTTDDGVIVCIYGCVMGHPCVDICRKLGF